jgi:hypothetical protein
MPKIEIELHKTNLHVRLCDDDDKAVLTHIFGTKSWEPTEEFSTTGSITIANLFIERTKEDNPVLFEAFLPEKIKVALLQFFLAKSEELNVKQ